MAKASQKGSSSGPARIRFVVLEAELPDGDLSQITQAVQNALRPPENSASHRRTLAAPTRGQPLDPEPADNGEDAREESVIDEASSENSVSASSARQRPSFKARSPNVIDVDLKSGEMPFADFAKAKNPSSHAERNLVVAAWFKLHRGIDAVTMDHVYTCYRAAGWPSGMEDFSKTLRQLKARKLMDSKERGAYAINHIGLDQVDKIGNAS